MSPLHEWSPEEWNDCCGESDRVYLGFRPSYRTSVLRRGAIVSTRPSAARGRLPGGTLRRSQGRVVAITASAALEYGPEIRVNSVSPG